MRMARIKSRPPAASVLSQGVPDVPAALQVLLCCSARDAVRGRERGGGLDMLEWRRRGGEVTHARDSFKTAMSKFHSTKGCVAAGFSNQATAQPD